MVYDLLLGAGGCISPVGCLAKTILWPPAPQKQNSYLGISLRKSLSAEFVQSTLPWARGVAYIINLLL